MKTGLICPIPDLEKYGHGDFHLILSHLVDSSPTYREHYQREAANGAWVVLDNSAHEFGEGGDPSRLLEQAISMGVSELVCPDVLFDGMGTVRRTSEALEYFAIYHRTLFEDRQGYRPLRLMMVPQGKTPIEFGMCLHGLVDTFIRMFGYRAFTIGVSKDYEMWDGGLPALITKYIEPYRRLGILKGQIDVHLLGWGRQYHVLPQLAKQFPWLRSVDSAKPFVYGLHGIELDTERTIAYPKRPPEYFQIPLPEDCYEIIDRNISFFRAYAAGAEVLA